jgi:hypothetical protein
MDLLAIFRITSRTYLSPIRIIFSQAKYLPLIETFIPLNIKNGANMLVKTIINYSKS